MIGRVALVAALGAGAVIAPASATTSSYQQHTASAYGPGLYGNVLGCYSYRTAHGLDGRLRPWSNLVAHRSLPCGTRLAVSYRGRTAVTEVGDRGPYIAGRTFDLAPGVWQRLGFPDPWAFGERPVAVRVLGPLGRGRPVSRSGEYPPRAVYAARARARVRFLVRKYGEWPPPVHDLTLAGIVAGWVLPQPPGSVTGARSTCAPATSRTSWFRCRVSIGARLWRSPTVRVLEDGTVRVVRG